MPCKEKSMEKVKLKIEGDGTGLGTKLSLGDKALPGVQTFKYVASADETHNHIEITCNAIAQQSEIVDYLRSKDVNVIMWNAPLHWLSTEDLERIHKETKTIIDERKKDVHRK